MAKKTSFAVARRNSQGIINMKSANMTAARRNSYGINTKVSFCDLTSVINRGKYKTGNK